jgi:hypothetical protein
VTAEQYRLRQHRELHPANTEGGQCAPGGSASRIASIACGVAGAP